jgi:hypothetical protein
MEKRRTPEKALVRLQALDEARARWWRRVVRAVNAIDKIDGQRKRLLKPKALDRLDPPIPQVETKHLGGPPSDDIPVFLRRDVKNEADEKAKAEILAEQADRHRVKAKASAARSKARAKGELRKMPLQGKDALRAIRAE